jgi:two-component system sensor histidine kinase RegB
MILQRLMAIRWATIIAYVIVWALGVSLIDADWWQPPIVIILLLLLLSNILLYFAYSPTIPVTTIDNTQPNQLVVYVLLFDVLLLATFLYFYGGYTNPFSMMFLVYTCIAALLLSAMWTWIVFLISAVFYVCLFFFHISIPAFSDSSMGHHGHMSSMHDGFSMHLYGMLCSFLVTGCLITYFLTRMRYALDIRQRQLLGLQQQALSSESMARVSALAAQSAHELSSPIASMTLVVDSLFEADISEQERLNQISVLKKLILQCRQILVSIRERFQASADKDCSLVSVNQIIEDVQTRLQDLYPLQNLNLKSDFDIHKIALYLPKIGLVLTLSSIIDNAAKYCGLGLSGVEIEVKKQDKGVEIFITNPCENLKVLDKLNSWAMPFNEKSQTTDDNTQSGLGIGVFLARQYLSSIQGTLGYTSRSDKHLTAIMFVPYGR